VEPTACHFCGNSPVFPELIALQLSEYIAAELRSSRPTAPRARKKSIRSGRTRLAV
jgi:hypothetical protein